MTHPSIALRRVTKRRRVCGLTGRAGAPINLLSRVSAPLVASDSGTEITRAADGVGINAGAWRCRCASRTCAQTHNPNTDYRTKSSANLPPVATLSCDWKPIISGFGAALYCVRNIVQVQNFIHYSLDRFLFFLRVGGLEEGNKNS